MAVVDLGWCVWFFLRTLWKQIKTGGLPFLKVEWRSATSYAWPQPIVSQETAGFLEKTQQKQWNDTPLAGAGLGDWNINGLLQHSLKLSTPPSPFDFLGDILLLVRRSWVHNIQHKLLRTLQLQKSKVKFASVPSSLQEESHTEEQQLCSICLIYTLFIVQTLDSAS